MKRSIISVIIPVGNDKRITDCLDSITKQEVNQPYEVIAVDSFCDSDLLKSVRSYSDRINLKIINGNSNKIGLLRNIGIGSANSEIYYFIDSDCKLEKGAISRAVENGNRNLITRGDIRFVGTTKISNLDALLRQQRYDSDKSFAYCPNLVVTKEVFSKVGMYNKNYFYGSDGEFAKRVRERGVNVAYDPNMILIHQGPTKDSLVLKTWIRYGEGRKKRYKDSSFREKVKALYSPLLFDLSKGVQYNLVVATCLGCRWAGWIKSGANKTK
jgi:GT2 family glycosyltransferase